MTAERGLKDSGGETRTHRVRIDSLIRSSSLICGNERKSPADLFSPGLSTPDGGHGGWARNVETGGPVGMVERWLWAGGSGGVESSSAGVSERRREWRCAGTASSTARAAASSRLIGFPSRSRGWYHRPLVAMAQARRRLRATAVVAEMWLWPRSVMSHR